VNKGLLMYSYVHWLNRDFLQRFVEYLDENCMLLTNDKLSLEELHDLVSMYRLIFLHIFPWM
jgi:hypothetical protein